MLSLTSLAVRPNSFYNLANMQFNIVNVVATSHNQCKSLAL